MYYKFNVFKRRGAIFLFTMDSGLFKPLKP